MPSLREVFLAELPSPFRDSLAANPAVEAWLSECVRLGHATWPDLKLPADEFVRYVASKLRASQPMPFSMLRTTDLYLSFACLRLNPQAIAAFEAKYACQIPRALSRLKIGSAVVDDIQAELRERFFMGTSSAPPLIGDYSGRGDLGSWVRSVAVHAGLKVRRRPDKSAGLDAALDVLAPEGDPELAHLKTIYAAEFKGALSRAVTTLPVRERNLLRQYYLDGLNIDALARLHGVHRATAARWMVDLRELLLRAVKKDLSQRLAIGARELEVSLLRLARTGIDIDISSLLRAS